MSTSPPRHCSRNGCPALAVATLTYVYAQSTVFIAPLAGSAEPHSYDLCEQHATSLTAPRGWQLRRFDAGFDAAPVIDDLLALADAVREPRRPPDRAPQRPPDRAQQRPSVAVGRRNHLRALPDLRRS